ncbi:hypothetical protein ACM911_000159 [Cronobacter dublinensis]
MSKLRPTNIDSTIKKAPFKALRAIIDIRDQFNATICHKAVKGVKSDSLIMNFPFNAITTPFLIKVMH